MSLRVDWFSDISTDNGQVIEGYEKAFGGMSDKELWALTDFIDEIAHTMLLASQRGTAKEAYDMLVDRNREAIYYFTKRRRDGKLNLSSENY